MLSLLVQAAEPAAPLNLSEGQKAALRECADLLQPLWEILSRCISKVEAGLGEQSPQQELAHLLPPEAAQVKPQTHLGVSRGGGSL